MASLNAHFRAPTATGTWAALGASTAQREGSGEGQGQEVGGGSGVGMQEGGWSEGREKQQGQQPQEQQEQQLVEYQAWIYQTQVRYVGHCLVHWLQGRREQALTHQHTVGATGTVRCDSNVQGPLDS